MRRKDRQRDVDFAKQVFADSEYCTLAMVDENNKPYCIPISPVIDNDHIYFHCATEGKKLDILKNNNNVCISCVSYTKLLPEKYTTEYKSAVATGRCEIVLDKEEALHALLLITKKYAMNNLENFEKEVNSSEGKVYVMRVTIDTITGKANI